MYFSFPYFNDRPHIPITIVNGTHRARFLPLLDSGADYSVFFKSDAIRIGLDWERGKNEIFHTTDGKEFMVKKFQLWIEIESKSFPVEIGFMENNKSSMPLLGRKGFFENFTIKIEERKKQVVLMPNL